MRRSFIPQKRVLRTIKNSKLLFKSSGILKLFDMYEHQAILFIFGYLSINLQNSFLNTTCPTED